MQLGFCHVFFGKEEEKQEHAVEHIAAAISFWEEEGSPSLFPLHLYPVFNEVGVFGC